LENAFGTNGDWLGISDVFVYLSEESQSTLWAQTMQSNGYYDEDWNPDTEKINSLVTYVNRQTKDFIFDIEDTIGQLSDSTLIKLISTRALIAFTQKISTYGNWLYPYNINYSEISLNDVLLSVFTSDYTKFISMDMNIAEYIGDEHGWFTLIVFDFMVICMFIFVNAVNLMIPILYLLLGGVLLARVLQQRDAKVPLKGYAKVSLLVFLTFTAFDLSLVMVKKLNGSTWSVYIMLVITLLSLWIIYVVLSSVFSNIDDFGNAKINERFYNLSQFFKLNNIMDSINMRTHNSNNVFEYKRLPEQEYKLDKLDAYDVDASVDSFYDNDTSVDNLSNFYNDDDTAVDDLTNLGGN
jgi:hypothetical protein